ncbi:hypothetical protein FPCIR_9457 [Fusarium pseudocircinatum]|uniref:Uncharacterized protein n=1 Tax=Fusarium pseudocircinatum TaxID=56676 RepID=A0A8H5NZH7_9HYPO|nr:hypothetical protein FPCIR_9457 [Fusarium pseudocircinatum]
MKLVSKPDPPPQAILRPDPQVLTSTCDGKGKPKTQKFAHMLALAIWDARGPQIQVTDFKLLEAQLDAAETFLTCDTTCADRKAYEKEATRKECYEYLVDLSGRIEEAESDFLRPEHEEKVDIFNAVDIVYSSFYPQISQGPMAGKYWGAVRPLTELTMLDGRPVSDIAGSLWVSLLDLKRNLFALQNLVIYLSDQERAGADMPPEFSKAWLYNAYSSNDDPNHAETLRQVLSTSARASATRARGRQANTLEAKVAIYRLRKSLTAIDTEDIVMSQIEHKIVLKGAEKQYNNKRHYSETLPPPHSQLRGDDYNRIVPVSYAQEAVTANDYMELHDDFLFDMASSSKLSPTDAGGLRGLFFLECLRLIEQREFECRRFGDSSKDLKQAITYKMDFTRDRQERAIYAFILVTIIFLPISAVSSIFAMNTTDVRDLNYSQWLWVVAIPVTVLVIVLGLWFMGELGHLARWLFGRLRKGSTANRRPYHKRSNRRIGRLPQPLS